MTDNSIPKLTPLPVGKLGLVTFNGKIYLERAETVTIEKLRQFGDPIIRLEESGIKGVRRPDILWRGEEWEIKTIKGSSRDNISRAIKVAKTQSRNIIIDIPKTKRQVNVVVKDVLNDVKHSAQIKRVILIIGKKYCQIK